MSNNILKVSINVVSKITNGFHTYSLPSSPVITLFFKKEEKGVVAEKRHCTPVEKRIESSLLSGGRSLYYA